MDSRNQNWKYMGVNFRGQRMKKGVGIFTYFGLKYGQGLEDQATQPHQEF